MCAEHGQVEAGGIGSFLCVCNPAARLGPQIWWQALGAVHVLGDNTSESTQSLLIASSVKQAEGISHPKMHPVTAKTVL